MEPATKTCPACRATVLLYASVCDRCGYKFPPQTLPDKDPDSDVPAEPGEAAALRTLLVKHAQKGICLLGALVGSAGVFMPLFSFGPFGTFSHVRVSIRIVLIGLSLIAVCGAFLRKYVSVAFLGAAMLTYQCMMFIPRWNTLRAVPGELNSGPYSLHLQYGWLFLILGPMLLVLGSAYDLFALPSEPEERAEIERKRGRFLVACLAGMGAAVFLVMSLRTRPRVRTAPQTTGRPVVVASAAAPSPRWE